MRKLIAVLIALFMAFSVSACEPESSQTGKHRETYAPKHAAPTKAEQPQAHNPEVNEPGPQNDPGACNERGERPVELQAHWSSETDRNPSAVWTKNGKSTPFNNLRSTSNGPGRGYGGEVSTTVTVKCKDILSVNVKGTPSTYATICVIIDIGQDIVRTGGRDCAATYTVP
jgi:hypothetical protein